MNVADVKEANINVVGNWRKPMLGDLKGRAISLVDVRETVDKMKSGKAPGLDGFPVECLKKGGMAVLEMAIVRLLNVSFDMGVVSAGHYCGNLSRYFIAISFSLSFYRDKFFPLVIDLSVSRYFCSKISDNR